jgi:MFS family permease
VRRCADILRSPYVGALVASALLARLPIGINALAIVLYLREQTGSFAIAGVVSGMLAAGSGVGAPIQGRLVDRIGARRVLLPLAVVHALSLGAIVAFAELDAPTLVLVLCGFVAGFAIPPTSSVLRSMWTDLLEPRLHQAAYALDSTMIELIFISGPLLTAAIATITSPAGALIVSAIAVIVGTAIFTALPPTRHVEPEHERTKGLLGALASPGVRTLVLISLPTGVGIGMLEVGIPAFSRAEGAAATAGVLLAIWSLGSGIGGLLYGTLPRPAGLYKTHLLVAAVLPLTLIPLALAPSVWVMALLVIPAGFCIAPLLATRNELVGGVAPAGMRTEAYTWPITSFVGGIAIGAALSGVLVEGPGWRTSFAVAAGFAAGGAVLAALRRKTVVAVVSA